MNESGMPMVWWLWWFVVATVIYVILFLWFRRAARRSDADGWDTAETGTHHTPPETGG